MQSALVETLVSWLREISQITHHTQHAASWICLLHLEVTTARTHSSPWAWLLSFSLTKCIVAKSLKKK
jgi:hypothetical protein